jgi:hypothetical protein
LRDVPYIEVGQARRLTVAGVGAHTIDYAVRNLPAAPGNCANGQPGECFEPLGIRPAMVDPQRLGSTTRVVEIDNGPRAVLTLLYTADPTAAAAPHASSEAILASLQIG